MRLIYVSLPGTRMFRHVITFLQKNFLKKVHHKIPLLKCLEPLEQCGMRGRNMISTSKIWKKKVINF